MSRYRNNLDNKIWKSWLIVCNFRRTSFLDETFERRRQQRWHHQPRVSSGRKPEADLYLEQNHLWLQRRRRKNTGSKKMKSIQANRCFRYSKFSNTKNKIKRQRQSKVFLIFFLKICMKITNQFWYHYVIVTQMLVQTLTKI